MHIDIKLDDPRYCDGCLAWDKYETRLYCKLGYEIGWNTSTEGGAIYRPQKCIDEHGE